MMMNAISQPTALAMRGIVAGAARAPTLAPELKIDVAKARSFFGKYSAVTLIAAGKLPASPSARTQRQNKKAYMLTVEITRTASPVAPMSASFDEKSPPIHPSVKMPQNACNTAPSDQTRIAQR